MKKKLIITFLLIILGVTFVYNKEVVNYVMNHYIYKKTIVLYNSNNYKRDYSFNFAKTTNNFYVRTEQDILDVIYTVLNNGWTNFTFFCDDEYLNECINNVKTVINDEALLSNVNNFVHPYNSYNKLSVNYNNLGKIELNIDKLYTKDKIDVINQKVDEIISSTLNGNMDNRTKIKKIHDYIINNTRYDNERADHIKQGLSLEGLKYESNTAYGALIQNMAICGGYSDAMAIFLDRLGIINYKISNENHIWNLVNLDGNWYHLDLTWDDPIVNTNEDLLIYTYFLITTDELNKNAATDHIYSASIYSETKNNQN